MPLVTPKINLTEQLTKYISPAEIAKTRYKKYNMPKIKEGNLLSDTFFRHEELFDRKNDIIDSPRHPYSSEDLPLYDSVKQSDIGKLTGSNAAYIESELPYYVDIIGTNERVYLEQFGTKNPKYPYEKDADGRYKGFTIDEVVNIKYHAKKAAPVYSNQTETKAFQLLKDGFPISSVINIIKQSSLRGTDNRPFAAPAGLMEFLSQYPDLRHYVVTNTQNHKEVFDTYGAKVLQQLVEVEDADKERAYEIIRSCRIQRPDGSFKTSPELLTIRNLLYKADNSQEEKISECIKMLANMQNISYNSLEKCIKKLVDKNLPVNFIINTIKNSVLRDIDNKPYTVSVGLINFLSKHPGLKRYVITQNEYQKETFDGHIAKKLTKLIDVDGMDKDKACKIIAGSKIQQPYGSFKTMPELSNIE